MDNDDAMSPVTRQALAEFFRAQEQAFTVLAMAVGDIVGGDRLADALTGRLASLQAAGQDGENKLFAAALLSKALQGLRDTHVPNGGSPPDDEAKYVAA